MRDVATPRPRLGEYLINKGLVEASTIEAVLKEQRITRRRLGDILVRHGFLKDSQLTEALLELGDASHIHNTHPTDIYPAELLLQLRVMVVTITAEAVYVATDNPERLVQKRLLAACPDLDVHFVSYNLGKLERYLEGLAKIQERLGMLDHILSQAVRKGASDIHIMPKDESYTVMLRVLGIKQLFHEGDRSEYSRLVARVKDLSRLDLAERRIPQDGAFRSEQEGRDVDFRVATVPVSHGEQIVIRVLDPKNAQPTLDELGITHVDAWRRATSRPDGLCLICGPTGSGKTTTLNASVREMDRFGRAIYTAEDPVEYQIPYIGQVNINPAVGLDFNRAIKAFMRADPDIVVLGEIRDLETAKSALRLAETGHLVLATLHTESIPGAMKRLEAIGVNEMDLTPLLRAVLVQRLIRVVCPDCQGKGCPACHGGYVSRTVVSECLDFRDEQAVKEMIAGNVDYPNIVDDAIEKCQEGITNEAELERVFGQAIRDKLEGAA